jgi:hypothetical protein
MVSSEELGLKVNLGRIAALAVLTHILATGRGKGMHGVGQVLNIAELEMQDPQTVFRDARTLKNGDILRNLETQLGAVLKTLRQAGMAQSRHEKLETNILHQIPEAQALLEISGAFGGGRKELIYAESDHEHYRGGDHDF